MSSRNVLIIIVLCLLVACSGFNRPEKHYHLIMNMQGTLVDNLFEMNRYAEFLDAQGLDNLYEKTLVLAKKNLQEVSEMDPLAEDSLLRNAAIELFKVYLRVLHEDLLEIKNLVDKPGALTPADKKKLIKLRKQLLATLSEAEKKFAGAQYMFLRTYMPGKELTEPDTTLFVENIDSVEVE